MTLKWQPLRIEDAAAWSKLSEVIGEADRHRWTVSEASAAFRLSAPGFDPELDSWAVWDGDDLVAYATSSISHEPRFDGKVQSYLSGGVHPDWRGRGIGSELLSRVEGRASAQLRNRYPHRAKVLFVDSGDDEDPAITLLQNHGFVIARRFHDMERPKPTVEEVGADSEGRPGIVIRRPEETDREAVRLAHNDAFQSHWGSAPCTPEVWLEIFTPDNFDFDLSRVATDSNGRVLAYVLVSGKEPERPYVELVGSRTETRGQRLGRATFGEYLKALAKDPVAQSTALDVDADSPTNAAKLYSDLGFEVARTWSALEKPVS